MSHFLALQIRASLCLDVWLSVCSCGHRLYDNYSSVYRADVLWPSFGDRAVSRAGRAGGRKCVGGDFPLSCPPWGFSTDTFVILPSYHLTALLPYHITTLQSYHLTTLPPYNLTTLQPYHLTTLQPYYLTTLPPYNLTILQPYNLTTLPPYYLTTRPPREKVSVKEKVNEFCPSPRSSR